MLFSQDFEISKLALMDKFERLRMWFKIFDKDKDGKISTSDVLELMRDVADTDYIHLEDLSIILKAIHEKSEHN